MDKNTLEIGEKYYWCDRLVTLLGVSDNVVIVALGGVRVTANRHEFEHSARLVPLIDPDAPRIPWLAAVCWGVVIFVGITVCLLVAGIVGVSL